MPESELRSLKLIQEGGVIVDSIKQLNQKEYIKSLDGNTVILKINEITGDSGDVLSFILHDEESLNQCLRRYDIKYRSDCQYIKNTGSLVNKLMITLKDLGYVSDPSLVEKHIKNSGLAADP